VPADSYKLVVWNDEKKKRRIAATTPLAANSKFMLSTIITASQAAEMQTADGTVIVFSSLEPLIKAGLHRVNRKSKTE
jgi:hypothetical protein